MRWLGIPFTPTILVPTEHPVDEVVRDSFYTHHTGTH